MTFLIDLGNAMNAFGKCTEQVKTLVSYTTKQALSQLAHDAQMTESEYIRNLIMIHVHGEKDVLRLHEERLNKIASRGKE